MTVKEWLWSTEFWITIGPAATLLWLLCLYEDVWRPISNNKHLRKLDATIAICGVPTLFLFIWIYL